MRTLMFLAALALPAAERTETEPEKAAAVADENENASPQKTLAVTSETQRDRAARILALTTNAVVDFDFEEQKPPANGVGLNYKVGILSQNEHGTTIGVYVIGVFRDSAAGRAGVPQKQIIKVNGHDVGTVTISNHDYSEDRLRPIDEVMERTSGLFADAPDTFTLTLLEPSADSAKEVSYELSRGPVAPALTKFIEERLPAWRRYLGSLAPEAIALRDKLVKDAASKEELEARLVAIEELEARIKKPWDELSEFREAQFLPADEDP